MATKVRYLAAALALAATTAACGSSDEPKTTGPAGADAAGTTADAGADAPAATFATIKARIHYGGSAKGNLAVAAFVENPPKTKPPVSFDTSSAPTFPYDAELTGLEPGTYWIVAMLDLEPFGTGATRPGPEDLTVTSEAITIIGTETKVVEITLPESPAGDAGTD